MSPSLFKEVVMYAPADCNLCPRLCASRKAVTNGHGPIPAKYMIIAQNPGKTEEEANPPEPLIGWSGAKLVEKLYPRAGISPDEVFKDNIVKCRPPFRVSHKGDDQPKADEVKNCRPFLEAAIKEVRPEVIITLGAKALHWFSPKTKLDATHGRKLEFLHDTTRLIPMYHPAAGAPGRNPGLVSVMLDDWARLREQL